jgi:hypothetical protein
MPAPELVGFAEIVALQHRQQVPGVARQLSTIETIQIVALDVWQSVAVIVGIG